MVNWKELASKPKPAPEPDPIAMLKDIQERLESIETILEDLNSYKFVTHQELQDSLKRDLVDELLYALRRLNDNGSRHG